MWRYRYLLATCAILSILSMLGAYYYVMDVWHYTVLEAIYTVHQLSPMGVFYTALVALFSLFLFQVMPSIRWRPSGLKLGILHTASILAHPFWLLIMTGIMAKYNLLFTVPHVVLLYVMAVGLSYLTTIGLQQIPKPIRKYILGN